MPYSNLETGPYRLILINPTEHALEIAKLFLSYLLVLWFQDMNTRHPDESSQLYHRAIPLHSPSHPAQVCAGHMVLMMNKYEPRGYYSKYTER